MSKGSSPRVPSIPKEEFNNNWDAIFGKTKPIENTQPTATLETPTQSSESLIHSESPHCD